MSSVLVSIANLQQACPCEPSLLRQAVHVVFAETVHRCVEVNVAVVDDATIHALNREYLDHDFPTDVLSFPLENSPDKLQGEIVVSVETAQRNASEYGWSCAEELCLYVVHGALHLIGYGDKTAGEQREMQAAELRVLAELGIEATPHASQVGRIPAYAASREGAAS